MGTADGSTVAAQLTRAAEQTAELLMIDIDHFKNVNDRFSHAAGDEVLRAVAQAIVADVRQHDATVRYADRCLYMAKYEGRNRVRTAWHHSEVL